MQKIQQLELENVEIHHLAHLTPTMDENSFKALKESIKENGQEMPIIMYRGKCIDGRHRIKALRELYEENKEVNTVKAINENSQLSESDLRNKILNVYENRRHQTPTQKAIMAYREWKRLKDIGEKVGQGVIADDFGTSVALLGRVKKLESLSGSDIIEELFQGNKLNIGTQHQPILTDSLLSLINSFTKRKSEILANTKTTSISEDFTDEETKLVDSIIFKLEYEHSKRILKLLNKKIYLKLKNNEVLG